VASSVAVGEAVQTPFGKGVVREVRNGGHLLIDLQGRSLVVEARAVTRLATTTRRAPAATPPVSQSAAASASLLRDDGAISARDVDLHGLTVADALARAEQALNEALLADLAQLRLIHGKSGGRIRAALHRRLAEMPSVRTFGLDARNAGVTVVTF
jgi:DNA mismatch repair protein MutS2